MPPHPRTACAPTRPRSWSSTGQSDTLVPVADARRFVAEVRRASESPVLYAELAAAEHAFDIVPSVRTARVVETIERFLATIRAEASNAARLQAIG